MKIRLLAILPVFLFCISFSSLAKTATAILVNPASILVGNTITLSAYMTRNDTHGYLNGVNLKFKLDGKDVGSAPVTNGWAYFEYPVEETLSPAGPFEGRKYQIHVEFGETSAFQSSDGFNYATVYIATPSITVSANSGKVGSKVNITANLKRSNYPFKPVVGRTIEFYVNGTRVGSAPTSNKGVAVCPVKVPKAGPNLIKAAFEGDNYYRAETNSAYLTGTP